MVVAWHDAAFAQVDPVLTKFLMESILKKFHVQHKLKQTWTRSEALLMEKLIGVDIQDMETKMQGTKHQTQVDHQMLQSQKEL
jgi:hypothetical protein